MTIISNYQNICEKLKKNVYWERFYAIDIQRILLSYSRINIHIIYYMNI